MRSQATLYQQAQDAGAFAAWAKSLALANGNTDEALGYAERSGAPSRVLNIIGSKAYAGHTGDTGLAGLADVRAITSTFVSSLRNRSAFYTLLDGNMMIRLPLRTRLSGTTANATAFAAGEGAAVPVSNFQVQGDLIRGQKANGLITMTMEMLKSAGTSGEAFITRELRRVVASVVDKQFFASVIDGDTPTFTATDDPMDDVRKLADAVGGTAESRLVWVLAPNVLRKAATAVSVTGQRVFPELGLQGGTILDVPAMASDALDDGEMILVDGMGIGGDNEAITLEASNDTSIQFVAEPTNDSDTPTATELVSMFQTNSVAILATAWFGVARLAGRDNALAKLTGIAWGDPVAS
ncbi:phage major capsid protein [Pelagibacterium sp.]|uniref:phage major capsid family protein n=1 Tax=Pelagibacterium sp. TaxID=1967288 RepID=UPI003BAA9390